MENKGSENRFFKIYSTETSATMQREPDDIVEVDLTQYNGAWPVPQDYGLTEQQFENLKLSNQRKYRFKFIWLLPLLVFVLPNNPFQTIPGLKWIIHLLSYIFPLLQVIKKYYPNAPLAETVIAFSVLGLVLAFPLGLKLLISKTKSAMNYSHWSLYMFSIRRNGYLQGSPRHFKLLIKYVWPVAIFIMGWYIACDVIGYIKFYFLEGSLQSYATAHTFTGGIISGFGWFHGLIFSFVHNDRPNGFAFSTLGIAIQASLIQVSLLVEISFPILFYFFFSNGLGKWLSSLAREEPHLTKLYKNR